MHNISSRAAVPSPAPSPAIVLTTKISTREMTADDGTTISAKAAAEADPESHSSILTQTSGGEDEKNSKLWKCSSFRLRIAIALALALTSEGRL